MTTKIRVEQIKTSAGAPQADLFLEGDGTWSNPTNYGLINAIACGVF